MPPTELQLTHDCPFRHMMEIGQLDVTWLDRVPPSLRGRLQALLDDPNG